MASIEQERTLVEGLERFPVHPTTLVIFGGTGDLAHRKLLPAVYNLAHERAAGALQPDRGVARGHSPRRLPEDGASRSCSSRAPSRRTSRCSTKLLERVRYVPGTFDDDSVFTRLEEVLKEFDDEAGIAFNRVFYLDGAGVLHRDRRQAR